MIEDCTAVLLAGGSSLRFGSNKALITWGQATLIEKILSVLKNVFAEVMVTVKDTRKFEFLNGGGITIIEDVHSEIHPLSGIYSGMVRSESEYCFVCGCDTPFLQPRLISALHKTANGYDAAVPNWGGMLQPLCAVYSRRCLDTIEKMMPESRFGIRDIFDRVQTYILREDEVKLYDPQGLSFRDVDTHVDLECLSRYT